MLLAAEMSDLDVETVTRHGVRTGEKKRQIVKKEGKKMPNLISAVTGVKKMQIKLLNDDKLKTSLQSIWSALTALFLLCL